jgi:hypothetical protein
MQAASQRAKRSRVDRVAPRRVSADGAGNVLEHRPISIASASDDVNSETPAPHRLRSQHQVIAGPRDDPHETLIVHLCQSLSIART